VVPQSRSQREQLAAPSLRRWLREVVGAKGLSADGGLDTKVTTDVYGHFERAERKREAAMIAGVFGV
jgi:hypothetical protein